MEMTKNKNNVYLLDINKLKEINILIYDAYWSKCMTDCQHPYALMYQDKRASLNEHYKNLNTFIDNFINPNTEYYCSMCSIKLEYSKIGFVIEKTNSNDLICRTCFYAKIKNKKLKIK